MKKLITAIAIGAFAFLGAANNAEAGHYGGRSYNVPASTVYVSGYRYGRPIYTERVFIGYDRCGNPQFAYRTYSAPVRCYPQRCNDRDYAYRGGYYDNRRSSGASVSFSFGRR